MKLPVSSVTKVLEVSRLTSRMVTVAPGTMPFWSLTVPTMVPVVTWA